MTRLAAPGRVSAMALPLTYRYRRVVGEFVKGLRCLADFPRQPKIERCRSLADPAGSVVDGAVAGAKPATIGAAVVAGFLTQRDAAQMRAHPDDDEPFRILDAVRICLRIPQLRNVGLLGSLDLLGGSVGDEHRLAAPRDGQ